MADPTLLPWAAALGAGLLIGMERERRQPPESPAGLRSFVLASLAGTTAAVLGPLALAVVLAAFALLTFSGYLLTRQSDPGLTTEFALLLTVLIGALAQSTPGWAAGLAVVVAGVLASKTTLHGFVRNVLSTQEMESALLLAAAALVVLPLLPDHKIAWLAGLNLHTLWLLAVLVMAIQSLGHIAVRALGSRRGLALSGLAGGFVSSTATIASMAQRARLAPAARTDCLRAALLSNVATVLELSALIALIQPALLTGLLPAVGLYGAGALLAVGATWRKGSGAEPLLPSATTPQASAKKRPFQPLHAVLFASILAGVLLVADMTRSWLGSSGAIVATGLAGFADAHAASASAAQFAASGAFTPLQALLAIGLTLSTNAISKMIAGFAGAQWRFGVANAAVQTGIVSLFWLGLWLGTPFLHKAHG
ncbi:MAG: MgtC/SapB family protein [Burkholderiaceae bacterium]|nr:MgtC/SapB family protein [Burkholderiaceae bacterium]